MPDDTIYETVGDPGQGGSSDFNQALGGLSQIGGGILSGLDNQAQVSALLSAAPQTGNFSDITKGQAKFATQGPKLASVAALLQRASTLDNDEYRRRIAALDPSIRARIEQAGVLAEQAAQGFLPADVRARIKRDKDFAALQGGYVDSGLATAEQEKGIGLARLARIAEAPGLTDAALGEAKALTPSVIDVGSTLLSPAAITARDNAQEARRIDLLNQQRGLSSVLKLQQRQQLLSGIGSLGRSVNQGLQDPSTGGYGGNDRTYVDEPPDRGTGIYVPDSGSSDITGYTSLGG